MLITRKEIEAVEAKVAQDQLQENLDAFKNEVNQINDMAELEKMEAELIEVMKEHDQYLRDTKYELADKIEFEGKKYSRRDVAASVAYFIGKATVKWEMTLGMHQLVQFWRRDTEEIPYHFYDATLRTLNTLQFQGDSEWTQILTINEYMSKMHDAYTIATSYTYYLAGRHNAIIDRMKLVVPPSEIEQVGAEAQERVEKAMRENQKEATDKA